MAEWWSLEAGLGGGSGKQKTSSGRAGSAGFSGAGTGPVGTGVRSVGVQSRDPYIVGVLRGVAPERHREVLRQEAQRLTDASAGYDGQINQRRAEKYRNEDPQIQGWLRLIRGTDAELRANGGKPLPGTLNDRVQRIEAALGEPLRLVPRPVVKPKPAGVQPAGRQPVRPKQSPAPKGVDRAVSAGPRGYVASALQNMPAGRQPVRPNRAPQQGGRPLTKPGPQTGTSTQQGGQPEALWRKQAREDLVGAKARPLGATTLSQLLGTFEGPPQIGVGVTSPPQRGVVTTFEDAVKRAKEIAQPSAGPLPPRVPSAKAQTLKPNEVENRLLGRDVLNTRAPNVLRVREEDITGPKVAELEPSIGFLKRFAFPVGLSGWNASPEEMQETWELWKQQARAGAVALPPKSTGAQDDRMFAQVRELSSKFYQEVIQPRSLERYPATTYHVPLLGKVRGPILPTSPEAFEAYSDQYLLQMYERFPEWLQAQSKQRLPRQVIQYAIALKDLGKIQRQRAARLAVSAMTDIGVQALTSAPEMVTAGIPGKGKLATEATKELTEEAARLGLKGKVKAEVLRRFPEGAKRMIGSEGAEVLNRTIGPKALGKRYLEGAAGQAISDGFARPELTPEERIRRSRAAGAGNTVSGTLLHGVGELGGAAIHGLRQARSLQRGGGKLPVSGDTNVQFGRSTGETPLEVGDWVTVSGRPELGLAQVRQITRGHVVLWPHGERKAGGAIKVVKEAVQPHPGVSASRTNGGNAPGASAGTFSGSGRGNLGEGHELNDPGHFSAGESERNLSHAANELSDIPREATAPDHSRETSRSEKLPDSRKRVTLDLFGGERSQIPGAINVDLIAQEGVRASAGEGVHLPFRDGIADEIVASGPRATFLVEAARVLRRGGRIYINSSVRNKFGKLPIQLRDVGTLEDLGLRLIQEAGPLPERFHGLTFRLTDGREIPHAAVTTTILEKVR